MQHICQPTQGFHGNPNNFMPVLIIWAPRSLQTVKSRNLILIWTKKHFVEVETPFFHVP